MIDQPSMFHKIIVEDFDETKDKTFIKDLLEPYLKDLYTDLALRSS
jgi:hypothetical protein